jgi:hypothetical protein
MDTTERHRVYYDHITQEWLDDSYDICNLLRGENKTNLCLLKTFVRRPGLQLGSITFVNNEGDDSTLSDDQVYELKAVTSFLNHNQNWYGPTAVAGYFDITTTTRDDHFLLFIAEHDDLENNPVRQDNDLMIRSYEMRTRIQDNNNNNNNNNNRSRSNSPRSSRSTSPTAR